MCINAHLLYTNVRCPRKPASEVVITLNMGMYNVVLSTVCMHRIFGSFTMESILATAFGRVIDIQRGQSSQLTKAAADVFSSGQDHDQETSLRYLIVLLSKWISNTFCGTDVTTLTVMNTLRYYT